MAAFVIVAGTGHGSPSGIAIAALLAPGPATSCNGWHQRRAPIRDERRILTLRMFLRAIGGDHISYRWRSEGKVVIANSPARSSLSASLRRVFSYVPYKMPCMWVTTSQR
jgi:hypothetical protein